MYSREWKATKSIYCWDWSAPLPSGHLVNQPPRDNGTGAECVVSGAVFSCARLATVLPIVQLTLSPQDFSWENTVFLYVVRRWLQQLHKVTIGSLHGGGWWAGEYTLPVWLLQSPSLPGKCPQRVSLSFVPADLSHCMLQKTGQRPGLNAL